VLFTFTALPLLSEPLPLLSHFSQKRFEARISCYASLLQASRGKSLILSCALHFCPLQMNNVGDAFKEIIAIEDRWEMRAKSLALTVQGRT
jgi:hypothetical protein